MVRRVVSGCLIAASLCVHAAPAAAGTIHQSPAMRKNEKRTCPDGKPMHTIRSGRTALYGCG